MIYLSTNYRPNLCKKLTVDVAANAAPHRFFRQDNGQAIDDLSQYKGESEAEGDPFYYFDNLLKTDHYSAAPFSINTLTGLFSLALDQALPAKIIHLEPDQSYVITTTKGSYTPCYQCSHDNWFDAFSAHPKSNQGTGLEAVGYTTNRSALGDNFSLGNYEDTIFGQSMLDTTNHASFWPPKERPIHPSQRRARLETQTALYMNGYQRDWYGFNKGALIGSFDGVTWFAIGKSRRVVAKTRKLFLGHQSTFC